MKLDTHKTEKTGNCTMASAVYEQQKNDFGIVYLYIQTLILLYVSVKYTSTSGAHSKIPEFSVRTENSKYDSLLSLGAIYGYILNQYSDFYSHNLPHCVSTGG
jgi:hypothetical protein